MKTISKDGTSIAYNKIGIGLALDMGRWRLSQQGFWPNARNLLCY